MIRNSKNLIVKDFRSYGGMQTKSDHRPVIAKINTNGNIYNIKNHYKKSSLNYFVAKIISIHTIILLVEFLKISLK